METRLTAQKSRFPTTSSRQGMLQSVYISETVWSVENDHTLVMMCSDPRYRPATEEFLRNHFKIERYDIIAVPGGPAAILYSAPYYYGLRPQIKLLHTLHHFRQAIAVMHDDCGYYAHRYPHTGTHVRYDRQINDLHEWRKEMERIIPDIETWRMHFVKRSHNHFEFLAA